MRKSVLYLFLLSLVTGGCSVSAPSGIENALPSVNIQAPPTPIIASPVSGAAVAPGVPLPTPTLAVVPDAAAQVVPAAATDAQPSSPPTAISDPDIAAEFTLSAAPGVPADLISAAQTVAANNRQLFRWVDPDPAGRPADVLLTVNNGRPLAHWLYVIAAPFATVADDTTWPAVTA